ncbi:hypothetical protein ACA910_004142 [Epithemia clementina (nom. ined.)]
MDQRAASARSDGLRTEFAKMEDSSRGGYDATRAALSPVAARVTPPNDNDGDDEGEGGEVRSESPYIGLHRYRHKNEGSDSDMNSVNSSCSHSRERKPVAVEPKQVTLEKRVHSPPTTCSSGDYGNESPTAHSPSTSQSSPIGHSPNRPNQGGSTSRSGPAGTYRRPIRRDYFSSQRGDLTTSREREASSPVHSISGSPTSFRSRPRPPSLQSTEAKPELEAGFCMRDDSAELGTLESLSFPVQSNDTGFDAMMALKLEQEEDSYETQHRQNSSPRNQLDDLPQDFHSSFTLDQDTMSERNVPRLKEDQDSHNAGPVDLSVLEDEEFARRLQEAEGAITTHEKEDEELARRLQEYEEPEHQKSIESQDEELARRLQEEEEEQRHGIQRPDEWFGRETMQPTVGPGPEEVEEQFRILERIRMEQERQQLEWAMRESPQDHTQPFAGGPPPGGGYMGPQPTRNYGVPPRGYGAPPPSRGPPQQRHPHAPRDYAMPQRDYVVPPREYRGPPPPRDYAGPSREYAGHSREYAGPPHGFLSHDQGHPRDFGGPPLSAGGHYAMPSRNYMGGPPPREYAVPPPDLMHSQSSRDLVEDLYASCQRDARGRRASTGWQESQQHQLSKYSGSYGRRISEHSLSPRTMLPGGSAGNADYGRNGHPQALSPQELSQQELQRRLIVQKGQEATANAIRNGQTHIVLCQGCNARLQAPIQSSLVYCPSCGCVSPGQST